MDWQTRAPAKEAAKRLLLAASIAVSMSGCATQRGDFSANSLPDRTSAKLVFENLSQLPPAEKQQNALNSNAAQVRQPGDRDGVILAAPAVFAQPPEEDDQSRTGEFQEFDPTRGGGDGETESQTESENGDRDNEVADAEAGSTSPSIPDSPSGQPVEYFVNIALSRHPKILAARQRVAATANVIPQVRALPDPSFNNTFWPLLDNALQTAGGRVGNQMSVSQMVPYPEKLKTKANIASREVQMAQTEVDAITREITESVLLAYYEVWFASRAISIIAETKELVTDLIDVAEARYRSGGSQQDVLRAQLESDRLDEQLITLQGQKQVAQADLATLLQQPVDLLPEAAHELQLAETPQQIESLTALAEQCNPKLRGLAWEIQRDRDRQRLACLQQYPDFSVGLNWGLISDGRDVVSPVADGNDNLSVSFGTTLPIWREKINAGIREASHRTSSTTRQFEAERDDLYGKIRRLIVQADALVEQRNIYEDRIIPRTEDTLKLAIADYRGKRADFFTLIETYRELLMFETQLARIDASLAGTIAQLDRTVGCPF